MSNIIPGTLCRINDSTDEDDLSDYYLYEESNLSYGKNPEPVCTAKHNEIALVLEVSHFPTTKLLLANGRVGWLASDLLQSLQEVLTNLQCLPESTYKPY